MSENAQKCCLNQSIEYHFLTEMLNGNYNVVNWKSLPDKYDDVQEFIGDGVIVCVPTLNECGFESFSTIALWIQGKTLHWFDFKDERFCLVRGTKDERVILLKNVLCLLFEKWRCLGNDILFNNFCCDKARQEANKLIIRKVQKYWESRPLKERIDKHFHFEWS